MNSAVLAPQKKKHTNDKVKQLKSERKSSESSTDTKDAKPVKPAKPVAKVPEVLENPYRICGSKRSVEEEIERINKELELKKVVTLTADEKHIEKLVKIVEKLKKASSHRIEKLSLSTTIDVKAILSARVIY